MIRDAHYRSKLAHRARGIDELERRVGGVCADIDARLASRDVARVLELGCGYGTALLELRVRYGARVELHGLNREPGDGDREILIRNAAERGWTTGGDAFEWPTIAYGDAGRGLPFADESFDIVFSQVAWRYFGNKIGVLQDVIRVLAPDGIARIDADEIRPGLPPEYARLVEIWQEGALLPFSDYLRRFGMEFAPAREGEYLRITKTPAFGRDLTPVCEVDLSRIHAHWDGIKCVYACGS